MKRNKISLICLVTIMATAFTVAGLYHYGFAAEKFPARPITLVGCFGVGGGLDTALRLLSTLVPQHMGVHAVVIAKPGGAGIVAGDHVVKAKPDGYTVAGLVASGSVPEVYTHFRKATYTSADLTPIALLNIDPFVLTVRTDSAFKTFEELIDYARKNPGKLTYGHAGRGHSFHLVMEMILNKNNTDMKDVPFKGGAEVAAQVTGGHVDCGIHSDVTAKPLVEGGKLRVLWVFTPGKKKAEWIEAPTVEELGYKFRPHYIGLFVSNKVPKDRVEKLRTGFKACLTDPLFAKLMGKIGNPPVYKDAEAVRAYMNAEKEIVLPLLQKLGMGGK